MIYYSGTTGSFYLSELHPENTIPADAVVITEAEYASALTWQTEGVGQIIIASADGRPVIGIATAESGDALIKSQILALEAQQTPRRIREAVLGVDNGWMAGIESQIEALRAQLGTA